MNAPSKSIIFSAHRVQCLLLELSKFVASALAIMKPKPAIIAEIDLNEQKPVVLSRTV